MNFFRSFQTAIECTYHGIFIFIFRQSDRQTTTKGAIKNRLLCVWLSLLLPSTTFNAAAGGANIAITFNICSCCRGSSSHCVSIASSTSASSSKCQEKLHVTLNRASPVNIRIYCWETLPGLGFVVLARIYKSPFTYQTDPLL